METEFDDVLQTVKKLYNKFGIKSVTMDDVAKELGKSKKTLYQFVQNKDELVEKVFELLDKEHEIFFKNIESNNLNAIQSLLWVNKLVLKMFENYNPSIEYDLKKYHPEVFQKIKNRGHERMYNSVLNNIKQGKREGLYRKNINEEIIAKLYVLRIDSISETDLIPRKEMMSPEFVNQIMEYHIRGIANKKGIKEFENYKENINNNEEN